MISYSRAVVDSLAVADKLAKDGISIEIIDLRTISPIDFTAVLTSVARTKRAVVVHEAVRDAGVGAEISARIGEELFGELKRPVVRIGGYRCPVPFAKPLETEFMPNQNRIEAAIRKVLS